VDEVGNTVAEQRAVTAVTAENARAVGALLELERQAVQLVAGPMRKLLANIFRMMASKYVLMFGSLDAPATADLAPALTDMLMRELEHLRSYDPTEVLLNEMHAATRLGILHANRYLIDPVPETTAIPMGPAVTRALDQLGGGVDRAVTAAQEFAESHPIGEWKDVVQQMGKASQAATGLDRATAWSLSAAKSAAIREIAAARGAQLLWVAEPDACVICLALSGHLIDPASGDGFDEFATFGKPSDVPGVWPPDQPLMGPPRHVNCRCVPELWVGPALEPGGLADTSLYSRPDVGATVDLPAALRREAKRSIVYGWSVPSESSTVRLDAAARLLAKGAGLPKSVEARGRKFVAAGKFDNRVHPSHRRTAHRST